MALNTGSITDTQSLTRSGSGSTSSVCTAGDLALVITPTDDARATLAAIKRHANRSMTDDAQRARYGLIEAVLEFAEIEFNPRCYLESGYRLSRPLYPPGCEPIKPPEPVRIMPDMLAEHEEDAWRLRVNPWHGLAG